MSSNSVSHRLLAAAVFMAVLAAGSPAKAEVTKFMHDCGGKLCPYYRASLAIPQGWREDRRLIGGVDTQIVVPAGRTFDDADAVIYATVGFNRNKTPITALVAEDHANWRKKNRDVKIEPLPDIARAAGQEPFLLYRFETPSRKEQPFELVAWTADVDKDGNAFIVNVVLTATSMRALKAAEPAYVTILKGY
jgi:hypothetical protein